MAFAPVFQRPFAPTFDRHAAAAAAANWWEAGGAPTPVAVYQPKGAASLAASYVNLANPGTYDATPGVAPTLDATGWTFNGTTQYLTLDFSLASECAILCRFTNFSSSSIQVIMGIYGARYLYLAPNIGGYVYYGLEDRESGVIPNLSSGVLAVAGATAYRNGVYDGISGIISATGWDAYKTPIGCGRLLGGEYYSLYAACTIIAVAVWDTSTDHATWMPAVSAAVALI